MHSPSDKTASVPQYNMGYVWSISLVAALGGLMFGYDWIVISGTKPFYERFFGVATGWQEGWAMASALVGCLTGAVLSGGLSDRFGRKRLLILAAYPNRIRGAAMSISVFALWTACFLLTITYPLLDEHLGTAGPFWIYAAICAVGFLFTLRYLTETKGKTLEEIEKELVD